MAGQYTIGTLARETGVNVETIRFYQRRGLIEQPLRPPGGIRRYTHGHARRLRFVKEAQGLGFSLDEILDLLALEDGRHCREAEQLGCKKLDIVRSKIAQLRRVESLLSALTDQCHRNSSKACCPLIAALEAKGTPFALFNERL